MATSTKADKTAEQKADEAKAATAKSTASRGASKNYKGVGDQQVEAFRWEGDIDAAPEWVDRGWAGYDNGPALQVPTQRRAQQPYTTTTCRIGDYVIRNQGARNDPQNDTFKVLTAADMGAQYDTSGDNPPAAPGNTGSFRPPQESGASLSDMAKTGVIDPEALDPEAKGKLLDQQAQQGGAPAAEINPDGPRVGANR